MLYEVRGMNKTLWGACDHREIVCVCVPERWCLVLVPVLVVASTEAAGL